MNCCFLDFEKPILELEEKIKILITNLSKKDKKDPVLDKEIQGLQKRSKKLTEKIFSRLEDWQIVQISRHYMRPHTLDYIKNIFTDFDELHGDRYYSDDNAIVGGIARLNGRPIVVIGHQKGRGVKDRIFRNFGMPTPEGYRKALRIMKLADKFRIPLITFIDTPGAYPGIGAEKRGQSRAIAKNLQEMSDLRIPIVCTIIGEGGSGGALAIGVGDKINMLKYSTYSVISPEGCATILWKDVKKAHCAAKSMHIVTKKIKKLNLIDSIIPEPLGGAHRDFKEASRLLKKQILFDLLKLDKLNEEELLFLRYKRLMDYGY